MTMRRRRRGARRGALAAARGALAAAMLLLAAGCGNADPSAPVASAMPVGLQTAGPSATASAAPSPEPTASVPPGQSSGIPGADVVMDPSLLEILPPAIGSARVEVEPASFGEAVTDPSFVANVDGAVFAIVTEGEDLASGVVAHLRPDVYSEAFYRDWRDSYDEGACAQAGGVRARAEVGIEGDRPMYVTTCAEDLRVYHAYVPEREVIVSLFSLGERRFGEQLMTDLRP
ncbi:MAG: hypothetical protein ACYC65_06995 [Candidatus Limnocylindrales bacterium]